MAFDLPDDGVSYQDLENTFYNNGGTKPPLCSPQLDEYQDMAREHDTNMDVLKQERERKRHE